MKIRLVSLFTFILLIASIPACANKNSIGPFFLPATITLNGAEVPSGIYNLSWDTKGTEVRVTFWKDGRFVATARGAWVKHGVEYSENVALLRVNSDGSRSLTEIRLSGMKKTIVIDRDNSILQVRAQSR